MVGGNKMKCPCNCNNEVPVNLSYMLSGERYYSPECREKAAMICLNEEDENWVEYYSDAGCLDILINEYIAGNP
jgi:hypothetical protein